MKPIEDKITRFLRGRLYATLLFLAGIAIIASGVAMTTATTPTAGLAGHFPPVSLPSPTLDAAAAIAAMLATMLLMLLINRFFNILRTSSKLFIGLYALMAAATPGAMGEALNGPILALAAMVALVIMYTTYQRSLPTRRIFLVFTLMSAGACMQWSYAAFLPMFLMGCGQMRCLTFRSILAAGVGMLTPPWILWGFSLIGPGDMVMPDIAWPTATVFRQFTSAQLLATIDTVAIAILATLYNTIRMFGLNAQTRAFNGIFATLTLWTALLTIIDFGHAATYMPLLTALTAMQATLFFRICIERRGYIGVIVLTLIFISVFFMI